MTMFRNQPCLRQLGVNLGYYKGKEIWPRKITERTIGLKLHDYHFCLIWKSEGVGFIQAFKELKDNFKLVDIYITEENVNSHFENIYVPKKIVSHLINFVTYDLKTHNTDRPRFYVFCFYRLTLLAGKYNRDLTPYELDKCKKKLQLHLMEIILLVTL